MILPMCSGAELAFQFLLFEFCLLMRNIEISQKPLCTVSNLIPNYMTLHFLILIHIPSNKFIKKSLLFNTSGLALLFITINVIVCQPDHKKVYGFSQLIKKKVIIKNQSFHKSYKLSVLYIYFQRCAGLILLHLLFNLCSITFILY